MNILFISRAFPPMTGGIENQNAALSVWLPQVASADTIANHYGKKFLAFFFPYATLRALFRMSHYDVLLLGDGVLAPLGVIVKFFYPKKTIVSIVHGLDLTYRNTFYQKFWVQKWLPSLDGLIAVSTETKNIALSRNIAPDKVVIVWNGIDTETLSGNFTRADLVPILGENSRHQSVLLTTGRLARRKGAEWFVRNVLPTLPKNTLYVLAGSGSEEAAIRQAIKATGLETQVRLLGRVTDTVRNTLLHTVDIFIQPNIRVPHDVEGFGIAVIEAAACGRPVIASQLEGLKDAIIQGENGILVEPENAEAFRAAIENLLENETARLALGERARQYTLMHYHWKVISKKYVETLENFMKK